MAPLDGNAVIELSPGMVFPIVDRILGGKGGGLNKPRELTEIESRIIHRIVTMILDCLKRSWEQLVEFHLTIAAQESDPLIVQIVAGSEMVILVGYEVHVGGTTGSMNMCIPLVVLNPILDQISQQTRFKRKMSPDEARRMRTQITRAIRKTSVPVDAILGHAHLCLDELARLEVGDILQLDSFADDPITVEVGGIEEYLARPGRRGEQSAIQLSEVIREEEGVEELP
jgi:flagellar motor switch protein FliM